MVASTDTTRTRVSVIGTGAMGSALAGRLLDSGYAVTVWNRSAEKARPLTDRGAVLAASPAEAAADVEAIFLSLRDDTAVNEVLEGIGTTGTPIFNTSTVSPTTARNLSGRFDGFVSLPIVGAPAAVANGSAVYLASGPESVVDSATGLLAALTSSLVNLGQDTYTAVATKVVLNQLLLSGIAALSETVAVAQAAGLGDDFLIEFLSGSPLVAPALRNRLADIVSGGHEAWFTVPLGAKDLDLFLALGADNGVDPVLARAVRDRYVEAAQAGFAEADIAAIVELARASA
jgi:3-hydroxyisobutyrate dehydrogenase-like beta-hydroxyacid dehydrogenase